MTREEKMKEIERLNKKRELEKGIVNTILLCLWTLLIVFLTVIAFG